MISHPFERSPVVDICGFNSNGAGATGGVEGGDDADGSEAGGIGTTSG